MKHLLFCICVLLVGYAFGAPSDLNQLLKTLGDNKAVVRKQATKALTELLLEEQDSYLKKVYALDKANPLRETDSIESDALRKSVQSKVKRVEQYLTENQNDPEIKERLEAALSKLIPSKFYELDFRIRTRFVRPSVMAPQWLTKLNDLNGDGEKIIPANINSVRPLKLKCLNIEISDLRIMILNLDDYSFFFGVPALPINLQDWWFCGYSKQYKCETQNDTVMCTVNIPGKEFTSENGIIHIDDKKIKLNVPSRYYDMRGKLSAAELKKLKGHKERQFMFRVPVKNVLILNTKGKILAHFQPPKVKVSKKMLTPEEYSNEALMGRLE